MLVLLRTVLSSMATGVSYRAKGILRTFSTDAVQKSNSGEFRPSKPRLYFDLHKFKAYLKRRKRDVKAEEMLEMIKQTIRPPPDGWTVETFIKRVGFEKEHEETFIRAFTTWESLMLWDPMAARELGGTKASDRTKLRRKVQLFLHDLWPQKVPGEMIQNFQSPPLANEGREWTANDDANLKRLADEYDVTFGDPWLYISWDMQRDPHDVHQRYLQKFHIPYCRQRQCEFLVTKSSEPLRINRFFKIVPPFVYIVPSPTNFNLIDLPSGCDNQPFPHLPSGFHRYRRPDCFVEREQSQFEWQVDDIDGENSSTPIIRQGRKLRSSPRGAGRLWKEVMLTEFPRIRQSLNLGSRR